MFCNLILSKTLVLNNEAFTVLSSKTPSLHSHEFFSRSFHFEKFLSNCISRCGFILLLCYIIYQLFFQWHNCT